MRYVSAGGACGKYREISAEIRVEGTAQSKSAEFSMTMGHVQHKTHPEAYVRTETKVCSGKRI